MRRQRGYHTRHQGGEAMSSKMKMVCVGTIAALLAGCAGQGGSMRSSGGASVVPPSVTGSTYTFTVGETTFTADGPTGRVTGISFQGKNLLIGSAVNNVTYGSSFWTSPQTWSW